MMLLNIIKLIWLFVKEMIIGKNSLQYAIRKNRIRVAFFFAVILSFVINWVTVPKLFIISANHVKLEQELKATRETMAGYAEDKALVDQAKEELLMLRARVKELEHKQNITAASIPDSKSNMPHSEQKTKKSDMNYIHKRLNTLEN